jgi:hypothetical protein
MLDKVRENALSSSKSSDKTVKNKAATFKNSASAKNFSAAYKADDHKDSFSSNNKQLQSLPSKKGFIVNIALVNMHSFIEKLISKVYYVQPTESEKLNINDMVEALSKKDVRSTKFINLARQLKDNELDDEK